MSTANRRRKAPTRPPFQKARPLFPSLPIGIYRDGKLVKVVELDDPRLGYIRAVNSLDVGLYAAPVKEGGAA